MSSSLSPSPFGSILSQYRAHPVLGVFFPWEILQSATQAGGGDFCGLSQCVGGELESRHGSLCGLLVSLFASVIGLLSICSLGFQPSF